MSEILILWLSVLVSQMAPYLIFILLRKSTHSVNMVLYSQNARLYRNCTLIRPTNPMRTACVMEYILYLMDTCVPRVVMKYKTYSIARVGSTNFKITKMAGYAKEIDVVVVHYFSIFCMNILVFRYNISLIDLPLGISAKYFVQW